MSDQDESVSPPQPNLDDLLNGIKREDGTPQYSTVEDALKSLPHAIEHIKRIEEENRNLKEGKEKTAVEKLLEQMSKAQPPPTVQPAVEAPKGLGVDDVKKILEQERQAVQAKGNLDSFGNVLKDKYQGKAVEILQAKAQELGVQVDFISNLAKTSPRAALELLGIRDVAPSQPVQKNTGTVVSPQGKPNTQERASPFRVGSSDKDLLAEWRRVSTKP
jgi:hypothetical protein